MLGTVQNQDSYAQGVAAQRPFYFDHVAELTELAMAEYAALTGRRYERAMGYRLEDAEYVLAGQGSVVPTPSWSPTTCASAGLKVGVLNLTMFRPFPADLVADLLRGQEGRHGAGAHRPAARGGPAAAARDPRGDVAGGGERPRRRARQRRGKSRGPSPSPPPRLRAPTRCRTSTPAASASAAATCSRAT
jgi:hypothetical protein